MMSDRPVDALRHSRVFGGLSEAALTAVVAAMRPQAVAAGDVLVQQGAPGDAAFVILSGRVRIERGATGAAVEVVREAGRGELIGEFALLTGAPRSATVRAIRHCELGRIDRDHFANLLASHGELALGISRNLAAMLGEGTTLAPSVSRPVVVVLRAASSGVPTEAVARALHAALAKDRRCVLITGAVAAEALGEVARRPEDDPERLVATARWLESLEAAHEHLLCLADGSDPAWDRTCLQQADLVLDLLAANGPSPEAVHPVVLACARELVVVHGPTRQRATPAASWMRALPYRHLHHLQVTATDDAARLARHLTGRRIGLALGGGGARGFAHIGLLRAASELGVPIDEIGGTSIGALVAAQWAAGIPIPEMIEGHRRAWKRHHPHSAYTLPLIGLVRASALKALLFDLLGTTDYADGWIESFACSCNLNTPGVAVHRRGPMLDACMASMAIPGLGPAVTMPDRTLHVDGGLVSNLPARQLRADRILVSDVSSVEIRLSGYAQTPSAWQVLRDRLRPRADRPYYSSLANTLVVSTLVGSVREAQRLARTADLCIRPSVEPIHLFDFHRIDEAVEAGYREGLKVLPAWHRRATAPEPAADATS